MKKVPFTERLDRWIAHNLAWGITLKYLKVHPDDFKNKNVSKLGHEYRGLPIYSL